MTSVLHEPSAAARVPAEPAPAQRWRWAAGLLAGLLLDSAFAPVGAAVLAPVGVAVLARATHGARPRDGAVAGLLAGLALFLPLLHWSGAVAGAGAWIVLALLQALFLVPLGAALAATSRLPAWPAWGAALWVGQEALRDRVPFGGFPWGRLAFTQDGTPLGSLAALGGAPLVTAAVALLGGLLAAAALRPPRRSVLLGAGAALAVGAAALLVPVPSDGPSVRVAVVQGNVPRLGLDAFAQRAAVLRNHVEATHRLAADVRAGRTTRPDLVLWPENASDLDPFRVPSAYAAIDDAVRDVGVPVLVGALLDGPAGQVRNSGIVWDPVTGPGETYVKQHPVPFGEYVPMRSLLRRVTDKVDLVPRDFARGDRTGVLQTGPVRLGDVICYEVAYDDLVRDAVREGGQVIVVQTNNATFGRSAQTEQQLAIGRLRAVEHGRTVAVAATSGVSAVIAPDGRVVDRTGVFEQDVLVVDVPSRTAQTPATRLGALPEAALALLGAAALLAAVRARRP